MKARNLILASGLMLMLAGACKEGNDRAHVARLSPAAYAAHGNQRGYDPANGTSTLDDSVKQSKVKGDSVIMDQK